MPTYDYYCPECGHVFEEFQRMKDNPLLECPSCHQQTLKKKIGTGAGIIFKGSGFYLTDYKNKNNSSPSPSASSTQKTETKSTTDATSSEASTTKSSGSASTAKSD